MTELAYKGERYIYCPDTVTVKKDAETIYSVNAQDYYLQNHDLCEKLKAGRDFEAKVIAVGKNSVGIDATDSRCFVVRTDGTDDNVDMIDPVAFFPRSGVLGGGK